MSPRPRGYLADWRPQAATRALVELAQTLIAAEHVVTPRRVLYVAIEAGLTNARGRPLDKSKTSYGSVIDALSNARRAGLIPWEAIADATERVEPRTYADPDDFRGAVAGWAKSYRLDRQLGQPVRLVCWSEHRGLRRILSPACRDYGLPLVLSGGADSASGRRFEAMRALGYDDDGPTTEVLHIGDRDKAGEDIFSVLVEDLPLLSYGAVSDVVRVALTGEQAVGFGLAGSPEESVQVDALAAPELDRLLREAITERIDPEARQAVLDREAEERADVLDWARGEAA